MERTAGEMSGEGSSIGREAAGASRSRRRGAQGGAAGYEETTGGGTEEMGDEGDESEP